MSGAHTTREQAIYLMVRAMLREMWGEEKPKPKLTLIQGGKGRAS